MLPFYSLSYLGLNLFQFARSIYFILIYCIHHRVSVCAGPLREVPGTLAALVSAPSFPVGRDAEVPQTPVRGPGALGWGACVGLGLLALQGAPRHLLQFALHSRVWDQPMPSLAPHTSVHLAYCVCPQLQDFGSAGLQLILRDGHPAVQL